VGRVARRIPTWYPQPVAWRDHHRGGHRLSAPHGAFAVRTCPRRGQAGPEPHTSAYEVIERMHWSRVLSPRGDERASTTDQLGARAIDLKTPGQAQCERWQDGAVGECRYRPTHHGPLTVSASTAPLWVSRGHE